MDEEKQLQSGYYHLESETKLEQIDDWKKINDFYERQRKDGKVN